MDTVSEAILQLNKKGVEVTFRAGVRIQDSTEIIGLRNVGKDKSTYTITLLNEDLTSETGILLLTEHLDIMLRSFS